MGRVGWFLVERRPHCSCPSRRPAQKDEAQMIEPGEEVGQVPEADPLHVAISRLVGAIFTLLPDECRERELAIGSIITLHERLAGLLRKRALN
jgi:hypothetical protein